MVVKHGNHYIECKEVLVNNDKIVYIGIDNKTTEVEGNFDTANAEASIRDNKYLNIGEINSSKGGMGYFSSDEDLREVNTW